jgi:hypothetical protein
MHLPIIGNLPIIDDLLLLQGPKLHTAKRRKART